MHAPQLHGPLADILNYARKISELQRKNKGGAELSTTIQHLLQYVDGLVAAIDRHDEIAALTTTDREDLDG